MTASSAVQRKILRNFVPLNSLSPENFEDLARRARVENLSRGGTLFRRGERDNKSIYLLSGEIDLRSEAGGRTRLIAGTQSARHPVAHQQPRVMDAVANTDIEFVRFDNDLLDILLTWGQSAGYVVTELEAESESLEGDSDWMTSMLQSNIFFQVPPANIQEVFKRMEAVPVSAGEVVIRQGEPGDFYYIIRQGQAVVTRTAPDGGEVCLARLGTGDGFGEEALIAECERNATVTMEDDGALMRLSKDDFDELLKAPVLYEVDYEEGEELVGRGAQWLDVRLESEHDNQSIAGSLNIPLCLLRVRIRELDPDLAYVVYCDSERRSAAAAYLLSEAGFEVYLLRGGLRRAPATRVA